MAALAHAQAMGSASPCRGLVAVKVQYPGTQATMAQDLANLRALAAFLSATEIRFDLVSAVEELQRQIHLEFDFTRWAGRLGASMQGATVCTQWACGMLASHA